MTGIIDAPTVENILSKKRYRMGDNKQRRSAISVLQSGESLKSMEWDTDNSGKIDKLNGELGIMSALMVGGTFVVDSFTHQNEPYLIYQAVKVLGLYKITIRRVWVVPKKELGKYIETKKAYNKRVTLNKAERHNLFEELMQEAISLGANDVYVRVLKDEDDSYAMFKVDGEFWRVPFENTKIIKLHSLNDYNTGMSMCRYIYDVLSASGRQKGNLDDATPLQEKSIEYRYVSAGNEVDTVFDIRICKTVNEKVGRLNFNMRFLPRREYRLHDMQLPEPLYLALRRSTRKKGGTVIISGPTGSGKSRTLFSLMLDYDNKWSIFTFEDPIEMRKPDWAEHIFHHSLDGMGSIAEAGKSIYMKQMGGLFRQNPDIIMLQEVRDLETAKFIFTISKSGHGCMTSIHANSAVGIIERLIDLGISHADMAADNAIDVLVAQRLVRKLCSACNLSKEEFEMYDVAASLTYAKENKKISRFNENTMRFTNPQGCEQCSYQGKRGRKLVAEYVEMDQRLRSLVASGELDKLKDTLKKQGMVTIESQLVNLVNEGVIDPRTALEEMRNDNGQDADLDKEIEVSLTQTAKKLTYELDDPEIEKMLNDKQSMDAGE